MDNKFELFTKIQVDIEDLQKAMKKISKLMDKTIDGIEDEFDDLEKEILKDLKNYEKKVKKTTKNVGDEFEDLADDIEDEFEDIVDTAEDSLKDIEKQTKKSTDKVTKEFKELGKDATKNFGDIEDDFEDATDDMGKMADKTSRDVVSAFNSMSDKAGSNFNNINSDFKSSVGKLSDISKDVSNTIQSNFKSVDDGLKGNFDSIGSQFGSSIGSMVGESNSIVDRIQSAFGGLTTGLRTRFSQISATFKSATGDMPSYASNLSAGVDNKIRQMGANAKKIFSKVEDDYKIGTDEIQPTTKKITTKTTQEFAKIPDKLAREFNSMSDTFDRVFGDMEEESGETTMGIVYDFKKAKQKAEREMAKLSIDMKKHFGDMETTTRKWGRTITVTTGSAASEMRKKFDNAINKMQSTVEGLKSGTKSAFNSLASAVKAPFSKMRSAWNSMLEKMESDTEESTEEMESEVREVGSAFDGLKGILAGVAGAITAAFGVSAISGFIDEAKELNKELGKVLFSMQQMGMSQGASGKAYAQVYSIIGDEGRAGETIQNLARVAKSEKELMNMAELVTDVHLKLGEAVTPEALAESIALSAEKGEIDGVLADVVNKCGISEEKFAEKLEKTKTQEQALNLITSTLSGTFAGMTDKYKELNPEMTKMNEAIANNQVAMMQLGETLAPLKTKFLDEFLTPLYTWLAEKLPPAIDTFLGWCDTLKTKLSEVDWKKWKDDLKELGGYISETLTGVLEGLETNLTDIATAFGLYDPETDAGKGMGALKKFFSWTEKHSEGIANGITIMSVAFAGFKLAGWLQGVSLALATNPLGLLVAGIAAAIAAILIFQDEIDKWGTKFQNTLQEKFGDPIGETFDGWYDKYFKGALNDIGKFFRGECEWQKKMQKKIDEMGESWEDFKEGLGETFGGEAIRWIGNKFIKFLNAPMDLVKSCINGMVSGINWLLELVNSPDRLPKVPEDLFRIPELAKGTDNWKGGTAIVGEAGQEIVNLPNGESFVTQGATVMNLPKGAQVIPNKIAKHLINGGMRGFADGLNVSGWFKDIFEYIMNPSDAIKDLIDGLISAFDFGGTGSVIKGAIKGWFKNSLFDFADLGGWFTKKFKEFFSWDGFSSGSGEGYAEMIKSAAGFFGDKLTQNELARVIQQINTESGGNPNAVQSIAVWDINAKTGNLAQGLLQYVPSTFKGYAVPGYTDIRNPFHQLLAFFNNSTWRKALPKLGEIRGWTPRGGRRMADGGLVKGGHGGIFANIGEASHDELVIPLNQQGVAPLANSLIDKLEQSGDIGSGDVTVHVTIPLDGKVIAEETIHITDTLNKRKSRKNGKR